MTQRKVSRKWVSLVKEGCAPDHREHGLSTVLLSLSALALPSSVGSPLMCWRSSNLFIESKPTSGPPQRPRPGTESCINTHRFLNLRAKTLQDSSNKPWRSVPGGKNTATTFPFRRKLWTLWWNQEGEGARWWWRMDEKKRDKKAYEGTEER